MTLNLLGIRSTYIQGFNIAKIKNQPENLQHLILNVCQKSNFWNIHKISVFLQILITWVLPNIFSLKVKNINVVRICVNKLYQTQISIFLLLVEENLKKSLKNIPSHGITPLIHSRCQIRDYSVLFIPKYAKAEKVETKNSRKSENTFN